ncbi:MAG TPA: T9SS type A sorting domain-containing protein [Candidatus Kapabacteria bacterium]|nr:T9SS type A sorting domain-containing protein [Candidatus Kapabacteria bacterium]
MRYYLSSLTLLIVVLLASSPAWAQADVRLSYDALQPLLPPDAQIESADSIGNLRLVVWGSTTANADGSIRNVLWMQQVRGDVKLGNPEILSDSTARPFGFVQVLALVDKFLVIWNDRRIANAQTFLMRIDSNGIRGKEQVLDSSHTISNPGLAWAKEEHGYRLIWNGNQGILIRMCDSDLTLTGDASLINAGIFNSVLHPSRTPNVTLLDMGSDGWLVVDRSGRNSTLNWTDPYYVENDGSLLILRDNRILEYASLLDTQPIRSFDAQLPPTAIPGTTLVALDLAGRIVLTYGTLDISVDILFDQKYVVINVLQLTMLANGAFSQPAYRLGRGVAYFDHCADTPEAEATSVSLQRECGNRYMVSVGVHVTTWMNCQASRGPYDVTDTVHYAVAQTSVTDTAPDLGPCASRPGIALERRSSTYASAVDLLLGSRRVALSAPVALDSINIPDLAPGIAQRGDTLIVAWAAYGVEPEVKINRWLPHRALSIDTLPSRTTIYPEADSIAGSAATATVQTSATGSGFIVSISSRWVQRLGDGTGIDRQHCDVLWPASTGWNLLATIEDNSSNAALTAVSALNNPDDGNTLTALGEIGNSGITSARRLLLNDANGVNIWCTDSLHLAATAYQSFVPILDSHYVLMDQYGMLAFNGTTRQAAHALSTADGARHLKLQGPRILTWYNSNNGVRLLITDTSADAIALSPELVTTAQLADLCIMERAGDSAIIMLAAGSNGLTMWTLDKNLRVLTTNQSISQGNARTARPSGVIRNDSLFIVWEDYRNGIADIYGRVFALYTPSGIELKARSVSGSELTFSASPNPARGPVELTWTGLPSSNSGTITIADLMGREVAHYIVLSNRATWDTRNVHPGIYIARLFTYDRYACIKIVVQ